MAIYNGGLSIKNVSIGTATGSGNAITSLSADGNVITPAKESTFLTSQDISGKEDKSNKVSSWSSTTTDAHYPSEKLVKGALDTKVNTADVRTIEEIQATTDLTGKVASADALKQALIKEKYYTNISVDSAGNIYFEDIPSADYIILSVVSQQQYTFRLALYTDGSRYYAKVFNADGTLAVGHTIPSVYVHYIRGVHHD